MKSLYSDVPEVPDDEYLFTDGIITVVCADGVGKITLSGDMDEPVSLADIAQRYQYIDYVIHEDLFEGEVFSYDRYGKSDWWLVGKTRGFA